MASNQAARAPRYLTTEEVIEGIFADKDPEDEFLDSEDDSSSEEDNPNATDERESVTESEEDEEIAQEQQMFSHDEPKQNKKKTLMILEIHKLILPVVKKTSNHLQKEQEWVGEGVEKSKAVGSVEGELEEEEEIDLEQQPV